MAHNLPLIPEKEGAVCADVRSVLREVFRDLDYVKPLSNKRLEEIKGDELKTKNVSTEDDGDISSEFKKLYQQEVKLQKEYAKRLARDALPNIYKLHSPVTSTETWKQEAGLIGRRDLKPSLEQNANCEDSLWVKNILNRSSGDVTLLETRSTAVVVNEQLRSNYSETLQSTSIGEIIPRPDPPTPFLSLPPTLLPDYIICIPSKIDFINYKVGQLYTQCLRLVNISKFEIRVSIRPPARRELDVELCSRLVVTSGSVAEMKIHYRPKDVRALTDQLQVRVSSGRTLCIPIACFMEPPLLEILVINKVSCRTNVSQTMETVNDVLDLGAKLLGDVHRAQLLLRCDTKHASFFLLSEDSWTDSSIQFAVDPSTNTHKYGIAVDSFFISPVRWSGGDNVNGVAVCRATTIGFHTTFLRIMSSTAIVRPLILVADAMLYSPKHITLQAHDKDYDICSEDDPACEYYVNLGIAFPHRSLSATINIINHSSLYYNYNWSARPWGVCCCWTSLRLTDDKNSDDLCSGAKEAKLKSEKGDAATQPSNDDELMGLVVDTPSGFILPRSTTQVVVSVPDVGSQLGVQRVVLMLILNDIPKESITVENESLIVSYNTVEEKAIPGISTVWSRETCDVVCAQMEVWWEVVPVRFTLEPCVIRLPHSRRVKVVTTEFRATQLSGISSITANWQMLTNLPPMKISPGRPILTTLLFPLSHKSPLADVIRLTSQGKECSASTVIEQYCDSRHPSITPTFTWLGLVPPGLTVTAELTVHNDTFEDIVWSATCYRWWGERDVADACKDQRPCVTCLSRACTCALLKPTRGSLQHSHREQLYYSVTAPNSDGCVATLVQVRRADTSGPVPGVGARAALIAYRVLAPHLVLRALPCYGDKRRECEGCALDAGLNNSPRGTAVLRPSTTLTLGDSTCCRLRISNITPLPTRVKWEPAIEDEDFVEVTFLPNEFKIKGHSEVDITVVLVAKKVCNRRIFIRNANVEHTQKPLYSVIDAAVSGVEVVVEFPIGDKETLSFPRIKLIQKDNLKQDKAAAELTTPEDIFTGFERKREEQRDNICRCEYKMLYIPPERRPKPRKDFEEEPSIEIIDEPPPLTRVCACANCQKPVLPEVSEPYCLQFKQLPLKTVTSRTVTLHNVSLVNTRWTAVVRRWPRRHTRTIHKEQWAGDVHNPGVILQCEPASGELRSRKKTFIQVSVYADCWGIYHDQILIKIENLEPFILDVWIEAIGVPLEFALRPIDQLTHPTLWMSSTDPERTVLVKNTSRADLVVYGYVMKEHEYPQDVLPFRLYIRLFDVPKPVCPCVTKFNSDSSIDCESLLDEMDTGVELYLDSDYGVQDMEFYKVDPLECRIKAFEKVNYRVRLLPNDEVAPRATLVLRPLPIEDTGNNWCRTLPPLQFVRLCQTERTTCLQASRSELRVTICALDLPFDDIVRIRKRFHLQNVGDGQLELYAETEPPWAVDVVRQICDAHCIKAEVLNSLKLCLPPRSSTEMVAEVSVKTKEVWPASHVKYVPISVSTSVLCFSELEHVKLLSIPLILQIEYPVIKTEPAVIDFGDVSDEGTRKTYVTVSHSSSITTLDLIASWSGDKQFRLWPSNITLQPGTSGRIYIEYTARWLAGENAGGTISVVARGPAGRWCVATTRVSAHPERCASRSVQTHVDYTDDTHLIPRVVRDVLGTK